MKNNLVLQNLVLQAFSQIPPQYPLTDYLRSQPEFNSSSGRTARLGSKSPHSATALGDRNLLSECWLLSAPALASPTQDTVGRQVFPFAIFQEQLARHINHVGPPVLAEQRRCVPREFKDVQGDWNCAGTAFAEVVTDEMIQPGVCTDSVEQTELHGNCSDNKIGIV